MDSLNHKCRKAQRHPFTSYQLARLRGWGFPELADYTELEVCAGYSSMALLPSSPFFATAKHNHLPYSNQIYHLQIPSGSFLTSQQPPASSSSSSSLLPWCFWHCTFLPLTPGRILTYTCLSQLPPWAANLPRPGFSRRNWGLWTTVKWGAWRRLFGSSCYTKSSLSVKETQSSTCVCELQLGTDPYSLTSLSSTMAPEASQLLTPQLRLCWKSQNQWTQNPTCSF